MMPPMSANGSRPHGEEKAFNMKLEANKETEPSQKAIC